MNIQQIEVEIALDKDEDPNEARLKILGDLYDDVTIHIDDTPDGLRLKLVFEDGDDVPEVLADTVKHLGKLIT